MKKIGIDARLYSQTGVGVYIRNLLHYLRQIGDKNIIYYIYLMDKDFKKVNFSEDNLIKIRANYPWHSLSEQTGFLNTLNKDDLDLMHFTYFSYPILYNKPFIATIHDLTPLLFKTGRASTKNKFIYYLKHFVFKTVLYRQVNKSKIIITPTQTVKNQLIKYFGSKITKKIHAVYEGVNYELFDVEEDSRLKEKFAKPFFIYVGNFYPHKNVERLVKAFSEIKTDAKLILIGPKDYFADRLLHCINKMKQKERFIFVNDFSLPKLAFFYKNAEALIHPSLSEGFGLPIVEAIHFNLPIIGSDIEVFKELLGSQYLSFDPENKGDIKDKIELFIKIRPSFNYYQLLPKFSFEKMTQKTLDLYRKS